MSFLSSPGAWTTLSRKLLLLSTLFSFSGALLAQNGYTTPADVDGNGTYDFQEVTTLTITCPANISVEAPVGSCSAAVTVPVPDVVGFCDSFTLTNDFNSTSDASGTYPVGTTTVIFSTNDGRGAKTCSMTVTVVDNQDPVIAGCPSNQTIDAGADCNATATWTAPTFSDNCTGGALTTTHTPGSTFSLGTTTVTYTATDAAGNTATCSFDIVVEDNTNPVITGCPSNQTIDAGAACNATATWTAPTFFDNCTGGALTTTHVPGSTFSLGTTTVTYTATDAAGNTATCSFDIVVEDNTNPVIAGCPSNQIIDSGAACNATATWTAPTFSDNCTGGALTTSHAPGSTFSLGTTTVTYTATDAAGNTATCSFDIVVEDNTNPVIAGCPSNQTIDSGAACNATATWTAPTFSDNCTGGSIATTHAPGSTFSLGTTTVTYTATDAAGNTATCSFDIVVEDNTNPVIAGCPSNQTIDAGAACNATATWTAPTFSDNCTGGALTTTHAPGSTFSLGTTTVTYTATDAIGNTATCTFDITVEDNTNPVIAGCPSNQTIDAGAACNATATWTAPTFSDNCTGGSIATTHAPGSTFSLGTTTVTYTATDAAGNTATCSFDIVVEDNTNPVIAGCPSNQTIDAGAACNATATWTAPTFSDNCTGGALTTSHAPGSTFNLGTTTVTYTATDAAGNMATCSFDIVVEDNTNPVIAGCPSNQTIDAGAACNATATWTAPTFSDNCTGGALTTTHAPGSTFSLGTTTVTYTATDAAGNTATCSFDITVEDNANPVIAGCPSNQTIDAGAACNATATWTAPTFSDNCTGGALTTTHTPGSTFSIGTTTVTYTATDAAGNTATCSFDIVVEDNTNPVIAGCPSNQTIDAGAACNATATWTAPTFSDNCTGGSITTSHAPGSTFSLGTTTVTYTATDAAGNAATCSFGITVEDNTNPVIAGCPSNQTIDAGAACNATATWTAPTFSDNCTGGALTTTHAPGSTFSLGTTTVTYTATDAAGNTANCSFDITVEDNEAPVAVCQNITINLATSPAGPAVMVAADIDGGSTDNCAVTGLSASQTSFAAVGVYNVTLTVTDAAGNTDDCIAVVTVTDNQPPVAVCQPVTIYLDAAGSASIVAADIDGGSTDNGAIASLVASQTAFNCVDLGTNNVTLTVTDDGGNTDDCDAVVTVVDTISPTAVCQSITIQLDATGNTSIVAADINNGSADNCTTVTISASQTAFTCANTGANNVTLTVTDGSGNTATCVAVVTVEDNIAPVISCPANIVVSNDAGACGAVVNYTAPVGTDNCANVSTAMTSVGTAPGATFPIGTTTVTYQVTDASSNTVSCSFTVTVNDTEDPTIACPANIVGSNDAGICGAVVSYAAPVGTDNCTGSTTAMTTAGTASGATFPVGTTTVTYEVTDASNNTATCSFTVTVNDTEDPTIACPANIVVSNDAGICGAVVSYAVPVGADNCTGSTTAMATVGTASGATFPVGTTTVTYEVTDASNNAAVCSFTVTVNDTEAPVAVCQNITINLATSPAGPATLVAADIDGGSTDNCAVTGLSASQTSFATVGVYNVTLTVTDAAGNTADCIAVVTVTDNQPPVAVCQPVTIYLDAAGSASIVATDIDGGSTDNGAIASLVASQTAFNCVDLGTNNVTLTVTDDGGNTDDCVAVVTVVDTISPTAVCQSITIQLDATGSAAIVAADINNGSTDNCTTVTLSADITAFTCANVGSNTVTLTVTDGSGNTATCDATVTVQDNIAPAISCPANIVVSNDAGVCGAVVNYTAPVGTDNCANVSTAMTTVGTAPGATFPIGTTTVTYDVTDASNNTVSCSFTVTVNDTEEPTIACPATIIVSNDAGVCGAVVTYIAPVGADNCTGSNTVMTTVGAASGTTFPIGVTTVTYEVTDASNNTATCSFTVTVNDTEEPTIACPANIVVSNDAGICGAVVSYAVPVGTDNCTGYTTAMTTLGTASGATFPVGTTTVTYEVTDASNNTAVCSFTVTVNDNEAPVAVCQSATLNLDGNGWAVFTPALINNGSGDNCAITSMAIEPDSFNVVGSHDVDLIVLDAAGNSDTCTVVVTVTDNSPPDAICQNITIYLNASGAATITGQQLDGGSTDNGFIASYTASQTNFNCNHLGVNNVALTVMDNGGNIDICLSVVTVVDTISPTAICQNITAQLDASGNASITAAQINNGSTDNCNNASLSYSLDNTAFTCANVGANTVTLTVTDASGNASTCTATVTIQDNIAPTITCPTTVFVTTNTDCTATGVVLGTPVLADNCTGTTATNNAPAAFPLGNTTVTWTATDANGNTATCTQTVTVTDDVAPVAVCQPVTIYLNAAGSAGLTADQIDGGSTDNCGINSLVAGQTTFTCADLGANDVTLTVTDNSTNTADCIAVVTVLDTINPVAICQNITVSLDGNTGTVTITGAEVNGASTDNCGSGTLVYTLDTDYFTAVGTNTVILTVTDASGNTSSCTATVTVTDNQPPVANCQDVTIYLDAAGAASIVAADINGGSTDNGAIASLVASQTAFTCADLGANNVTLTATDDGGNTDDCVAVVTVLDTISPNAICQSITVQLDATGNASITAAQIDNGSTDNCTVATLTLDATAFTCSNLGANTVTLTVTDQSGNASTCTATVTVEDNVAPTAICQNITVQLDATGNGSILASDIDNGSNDACGIASISADVTSFDCSNIGANTVILTVTDNNGNVSTCQSTVTIEDNVAPVALCQNVTTYLDATGNATINASDLNNGSTDACGGLIFTADQTAFDCSEAGANIVTLTVTDASGNTVTCAAVVTVLDTIAPVAICQTATINMDVNGFAVLTPVDVDGGSTDNCAITTMTIDVDSFSTVGTHTVMLTVFDAAGNSDDCTVDISVIDINPPTANCQDVTVYLDASGDASIAATDLDNGSTDNGTIDSYTASQLAFDCSHLGANVDTLFVTDNGGNTSFCVSTVTVLDTIAPTALCQSITIQLDANGDATILATDIDNGSMDNCTVATLAVDVAAFTCANMGANTVTLTVTDQSGNASTCTATVTVEDNVAPTAICQNITVQLDATGNVAITASEIDNGSNDACGIASISADVTSFDCSTIGDNIVTLTVTDNNGNVSTCSTTVTVEDNVAPVAICQNVTAYLDATGNASINASDLDNGSTDACGGLTFTADQTAFDCSATGANDVTLTVTDINGNTSTCAATVTVLDTIAPAAICQSITVQLDANGNVTITPAQVDNASSDNCSITSLALDITAFDCSNIGANSVTLTVTDPSGNATTCSATVTVEDNVAPTAICQNITVQLDATGNVSITAEDLENGSNDACGIASISADITSFTCAEQGANVVTLTVTDNNGNVSTCQSTVTVQDTVAPIAVCQSVTTYLNAAGTATINASDLDNGSSDACGNITFSASQTSFDCGETGANNVTLTVTDASGNTATCEAIVTVLDTISPVAICQNVTYTLPLSGEVTVTPAQLNNASTDNCTGSTFTISQTLFEHVGVFNDTLFVTDASGNIDYCVSTVTITDVIAPIAVCQPDTIFLGPNGTVTITAEDIDGGSTDNGTIVSMTASQTSFNCSQQGNNNVTLIVTDEAGNNAFCTAVVTVLDTIAPTAICQNISVNMGPNGTATITASQIGNQSTDNCGLTNVTLSLDTNTFSSVGQHTVILTVTDASGNVSTCEATVTVNDITQPDAICQPITVYVDQFGTVSITGNDIDGGSFDNDSIASYLASPSVFNCNNLGANTVVLTVTDLSGNTDDCVAVVTVLDTIAPTVICQNITVGMDAQGNVTITAAQINNGTTDNCSGATLSYSLDVTTFTAVGQYNVTLTVTDPSGNTSSCTAVVTVTDLVPPTAICQPTTIYLDGNGNASITASDIDGGSYDNGVVVSVVAGQTIFDCGDLGTNPVTLTVTDDQGNTASCVALVTVLDTIAPIVICQDITAIMDFYGNATLTGIEMDGGSTDNCGTGALEYTSNITSFTEEGTFEVMLTVTDASGNISTCTSQVTIVQPVKPLVIPSGFSPNGDGIADLWEIQGLREYPNNSVLIFNRWGSKIFSASPYLNDWNGQVSRGGTMPGDLPAGTYFYQLELGEGDVRTGYLQINK